MAVSKSVFLTSVGVGVATGLGCDRDDARQLGELRRTLGVDSRLAQVRPLDAADLLAFTFEANGGHGRSGGKGAAQLTSPLAA